MLSIIPLEKIIGKLGAITPEEIKNKITLAYFLDKGMIEKK